MFRFTVPVSCDLLPWNVLGLRLVGFPDALIPKKIGSCITGVFRDKFPAVNRSGSDEGIEVFGRPEGVHSEAGR